MAITNAHLPMEDPVALIRERIKEKRIFEARFLLRQFGDEIAADRKTQLADELAATLLRVEHMLHRARAHAAGGERSQAEQVYREIEATVIDMPGVGEEIKALVGASALIAKIQPTVPKVMAPEPSIPEVAGGVASDYENTASAVGLRKRKRPRWPLWLAAGCVVLVLSLLALWYADVKDTSPPPAAPEQPAHTIMIRPMVAEGPAATEQTSPAADSPPVPDSKIEKAPESSMAQQPLPQPTDTPAPHPVQALQATVPPQPTVQVGTLQIEKSAKK